MAGVTTSTRNNSSKGVLVKAPMTTKICRTIKSTVRSLEKREHDSTETTPLVFLIRAAHKSRGGPKVHRNAQGNHASTVSSKQRVKSGVVVFHVKFQFYVDIQRNNLN